MRATNKNGVIPLLLLGDELSSDGGVSLESHLGKPINRLK